MEIELRPCASAADALLPISHAMGFGDVGEEGVQRFAALVDPDRLLGAWDVDRIVGNTGAFSYELTVPGPRVVPAAGVTIVGVVPTHRRRGILNRLMRAQLDDIRERGEAVAILWASEERIYGRYGYGMASMHLTAEVPSARAGLRDDRRAEVQARVVTEEESWDAIPPLYEAARAVTPGMVSRTEDWWRKRRLLDSSMRPPGWGPIFRVVLAVDGEDAAYALYRIKIDWSSGSAVGEALVDEAVGVGYDATRELWRYLASLDLVETLHAPRLPVDHPLVLMSAEPRRLRARMGDALWCRLVDVGAALSQRGYGTDEAVVFEVRDAFCPWNEGVWRLAGGACKRADGAAPELRLDVADLGSTYLGAFRWTQLVRSGRAEELEPGAALRADRVFLTADPAPWCVEVF